MLAVIIKNKFTWFILVCLGIVAFVFFKQSRQEAGLVHDFPIKKHFKWRYKLTNNSDQVLKNVRITSPVPLKQTAFQQRVQLSSSKPFQPEVINDSQVVIVVIGDFAPYQSRFLDFASDMAFSHSPQNVTASAIELKPYLLSTNLIQVDNESIQLMAEKIKGKTELDTLLNAYHWIKDNLQYSGYIKESLGALYALENKKGDCTEYSYLMAALARANGIPARVMSGFVYPDSTVIKSEDLHNWVEVFIDNKWQVIDPQKERFMELEDNYLAFSIISGEEMEDFSISISNENISIQL